MNGPEESLKQGKIIPVLIYVAVSALSVSGLVAGLWALHGFTRVSENWQPFNAGAFVSYHPDISGSVANPLHETTALLDSAPIFVPGPWNAAGGLEPPLWGAKGSIPKGFDEYPPSIQLDAAVLAVSGEQLLGLEASATLSPLAHLDSVQQFRGLGQERVATNPKTASPVCCLYFIHLETGRSWECTPGFPLEGATAGHLWDPLAYYVAVGPLGLAAAPFTVNTSGLEELDKALAGLVQEIALELQLPVGNYRIVAGP